ncbi:hypothetical protein PVAP13_1KG181154 [Panicum virgatum]|uniref:Uncharacterized protein n=1 Tax=Panicum virgatum TaxID=38727 RepID=A0A8T0XJG4_PANVG|nr:hypothetical protein PVAP13_1KG181154 [Panicum virgatum]
MRVLGPPSTSNRSAPPRLFRETSTARSKGARQNAASTPPRRELPERSTVRRLERLPSAAQSTGPVRLSDGKRSCRTGRHARRPGSGGWKLETCRNAARTNSASGSGVVQLEEPLATAADTAGDAAEVATAARSRRRRRPAAKWSGISRQSRFARARGVKRVLLWWFRCVPVRSSSLLFLSSLEGCCEFEDTCAACRSD